MNYRVLLLIGLACSTAACNDELKKEANAAASGSASYTLNANCEGLIGYINTQDGVWALLPEADDTATTLPAEYLKTSFYPAHEAVMFIDGADIQDTSLSTTVPLDGYEVVLPAEVMNGGGSGLPMASFVQDTDPNDSLDPAYLGTDIKTHYLAARIKLPLYTTVVRGSGNHRFVKAHLTQANCDEGFQGSVTPGTDYRVEGVEFSKPGLQTLPLVLTLQTLDGKTVKLYKLMPANGGSTIGIRIYNKEPAAIADPSLQLHDFATYRYFYNLTKMGRNAHCDDQYFPGLNQGGNRCPEKLFTP